MRSLVASTVVALTLAAGLAGCAGDGDPDRPRERSDRPADPPAGWHTVRNRVAGFTISVPRSWRARTKRGATLVRSRDRLLALTVTADRGDEGRDAVPARYAQSVIEALPGFEGTVSPRARRVRGSPYRSARVDATGTLGRSRRVHGIAVTAFTRPGRVTYTVVAFREARLGGVDEPALRRILRSFRAQPARAQRSGRSG